MIKSYDKKEKQAAKYIFLDIIASLLAWSLFFIFRRIEIESTFIQNIQLFSPIYNFWKLIVGVPIFWIFIFWLSGYYNKAFYKSRLSEFFQTLTSVFLGSILLFFILLIDDPVVSYHYYYLSFIVLFSIYFIVIYSFRYTLTRITTNKIRSRIWGFNTLIIGTGKNAEKIYSQLSSEKQSTGNIICGFISEDKHNAVINKSMILGGMPDLNRIIKEKKIENVIVAIDNDDRIELFRIISQLYRFNVEISFIPQLYDYLVGGIRLSFIYGTPLANVLENRMPAWQQNVKRLFDIVVSCLGLVLASPLMVYLAIKVKASSKGDVFFRQERIGRQGIPFRIIKFRTMYESENEYQNHHLTEVNDKRVTPIGKIMRKYRLDELPQLCNVVKGDMSLVGPRPEQQYFIEKIIEKAPYYSLVHKVKPGITSWGMVKYGYANTVDKMIERLNYDIIYLENISILLDTKILIYTIKTIVSGKGL